MNIDGFTFVRNGSKMGYPFEVSIKSLLPLVDKLYVAVGDSDDGTREKVEAIDPVKIEIIDTIWDEEKRRNGEIFREQTTIALKKTTADWCFHLQVDEVLKEDAYDQIFRFIEIANKHDDVDGLLFPFLHFWGDYQHIRNTRRTHAYEIRAFKNHRNVQSYKDSQGFRIDAHTSADEKGTKLKVLQTEVPIYHYSYTRHPALMKKKSNYFHRFWHDDSWLKNHTNETDFDFNEVDKLEVFKGEHPSLMRDTIAKKDWHFDYNPKLSNMSSKDKFLSQLEKIFNYRFFEYKNYVLKRL